MQWNKYAEFAATHPELGPCLDDLLGAIRTNGRSIEDSVQRHLEYVAVRPWRSLDLEQTGYYCKKGEAEASVKFTVYAHIAGEEAPCSRAQTTFRPSNPTVKGLISDMKEWHQEYWAKMDCRPLVFDAVTRVSSLVHFNRSEFLVDKTMLSFYLFPEGFNA